MKRLAALLASMISAAAIAAEPVRILFIGNSFTYTRPPALQYNTDNVVDMNLQNSKDKPEGADPALPQPWGGIPGIIEMLASQAGLDYEIFHSLRGGATLRGHFLNTNPAGWDLRANMMAYKWDVVVIQGNSTEAVARAGGNPGQFSAYVGIISKLIQDGRRYTYRESELYTGGTGSNRTSPANPNANPNAKVFLYQTWTRPDLAYTLGENPGYYGEPIETMGYDIRDSYALAASANVGVTGVFPVGEAFLRAVQAGVAHRNPYAPEGNLVDLWWHEDQFHSSKYGSYLSALVIFGQLSGIDPSSFGGNEKVANDLGIEPQHAMRLQRVAAEQLAASGVMTDRRNCLHSGANANNGRACAGR